MRLLTLANPKAQKATKYGWLNAVLHLSPATTAGREDVCAWATPGCLKVCVNRTGRAGIYPAGSRTNAIQQARIRRTRLYFDDPDRFIEDLDRDLYALARAARRMGLKAACRLNGTSDIHWAREHPEIFEHAISNGGDVRFYDYTKRPAVKVTPEWYRLYSYNEETPDSFIQALLRRGVNVAVAFDRGLTTPERAAIAWRRWRAKRLVDGDAHDLRFLDPPGSIVGLREKIARTPKRALRDSTGFVVRG